MTTNLITEVLKTAFQMSSGSKEIQKKLAIINLATLSRNFASKEGNGIVADRKYGSRECFSLVFCFSQVGRYNIMFMCYGL